MSPASRCRNPGSGRSWSASGRRASAPGTPGSAKAGWAARVSPRPRVRRRRDGRRGGLEGPPIQARRPRVQLHVRQFEGRVLCRVRRRPGRRRRARPGRPRPGRSGGPGGLRTDGRRGRRYAEDREGRARDGPGGQRRRRPYRASARETGRGPDPGRRLRAATGSRSPKRLGADLAVERKGRGRREGGPGTSRPGASTRPWSSPIRDGCRRP